MSFHQISAQIYVNVTYFQSMAVFIGFKIKRDKVPLGASVKNYAPP